MGGTILVRRQRGVTLVELMLVAALVAVLASIAVPSYVKHVEHAKVVHAIADISSLSVQIYRWQANSLRFPATLAEAGLDGKVDPWGRPYVYLNIAGARPGEVRRDRNLVPINTDFDLYSLGKDGVSVSALTARGSQDDVVRANNGAFIGLAEDY